VKEHKCEQMPKLYVSIVWLEWNPHGELNKQPCWQLSTPVNSLPIHYCPFCGKKLEEQDD